MSPLASDATLRSDRPVVERREQVYRIICQILAGQSEQVNWSVFSPSAWNLLANVAQEEGVAPLLCYTLDAAGWPEGMPPPFRHDLRAAYYHTAAHNLLIYEELSRVLAAFHHFSSDNTSPPFSVVTLKGAALATTLYPDMALRPLSDLDLLVSRQHLKMAVQAVQSLGYRQAHSEGLQMRPGLNWVTPYHVRLQGGPQQSVTLELHWGLVGSAGDWGSPSLDWFWAQTEPWKGERGKWKGENGKAKMEDGEGIPSPDFNTPSSIFRPPSSVLQLTPTANLLFLAAHLILKHRGGRLVWFYDLHLLASRWRAQLDWNELLVRAREFRWAAALHTALLGAQDRFATPLPDGFLDALAETQDHQAVSSVKRKVGPVQTRAIYVWDNLATQGWQARLRLVWAMACPSPEYMRWRYEPRPAWLWPLYYPYRWFDIVRDGVSTLWQIVRGSRGAQGQG